MKKLSTTKTRHLTLSRETLLSLTGGSPPLEGPKPGQLSDVYTECPSDGVTCTQKTIV